MNIKQVMPKQVIILLLLFGLSVIVRLPNLDRPLSKHHEFCTAVTLRVLEIWGKNGAATYGFNPVMTYPGQANSHINNHASGSGEMLDDKGNYYYVSHPPLAYYLPYFVMSVLQVGPTVLSLQVFHLTIHLISVLLVFFLARHLIAEGRDWSVIPLVVAALYLFSPVTLWFQGNVYMADMLVQVFFLASLLVMLILWQRKKRSVILQLTLCVFVFAMCYTHWLGYFFIATLLLGLSWKSFRQFLARQVLMPAILGGVLAFVLMVVQYSQINGLSAYIAELLHRFTIRSSGQAFSLTSMAEHMGTLAFNYFANHLPVFLVLAVLRFLLRFSLSTSLTLQPVHKLFLLVAFLPPIILHLVLLDYSLHDFTTLYATVGFCGLAAILLSQMPLTFSSQTLPVILITFGVLAGGAQYLYINRPGGKSLSGERYDRHQQLAKQIRQAGDSRQALFSLNHTLSPQVIYYTKRNIKSVSSREEALRFLRKYNRKNGVILEVSNGSIQNKIPLSNP